MAHIVRIDAGARIVAKGVSRKAAKKIAEILSTSSVVTALTKTVDNRLEVDVQLLGPVSGRIILSGPLAIKLVNGKGNHSRPVLCLPEEL